jgi:hypothetical protein
LIKDPYRPWGAFLSGTAPIQFLRYVHHASLNGTA